MKLTYIINATLLFFELKDLRLFLCTKKAYFSQILFTNLSKSVLVNEKIHIISRCWLDSMIIAQVCLSSSLSRPQIYPYVSSSLTPTYWHFCKFYAPCSKCVLANVPPVHMFASNLLRCRFALNEPLPKSSLPNILVTFLFVDEHINRFMP